MYYKLIGYLMDASSSISILHKELLCEIFNIASDSEKPHTNIALVCKNWLEQVNSNLFWKYKVEDLKKRNPTLIKPLPSGSDDWKTVFFDEIKRKEFLKNPKESLKNHPELYDDKYFLIPALDSGELPVDELDLEKFPRKDKESFDAMDRALNKKNKEMIDKYLEYWNFRPD